MLHEYRDVITKMKINNVHFSKIFDKHNELDQQISDADEGRTHIETFQIENMKKKKLKLKDEALTMIMDYKREHGL